ncbi:hypothetical protein B0H10DRAFT_2227978 [Mycena sp. CBHHK59/15]|nr:hypothetical protein B0H10DRAFT_2227978 [Mycena sp. CBHHK59/15]
MRDYQVDSFYSYSLTSLSEFIPSSVKEQPLPVVTPDSHGIVDFNFLRNAIFGSVFAPYDPAIGFVSLAQGLAALANGNATVLYAQIPEMSFECQTSPPPFHLNNFEAYMAIACGDPVPVNDTVAQLEEYWLNAARTACQYASAEAKAAQCIASKKRAEPDTAGGTEPPHKKQQQDATPIQSTLTGFRRNEMPYGEAEKAAIESQALHAIVSGGLPLGAFEDHEMRLLIGMKGCGQLLKAAAADVEAITIKALKGTTAGLSTDGWKCKKKNAINAICANSYLIELVEVTALNKDGPALCEQFGAMIDRVEVKYGCIIIYFTTDADGGRKKGCQLLGIKRPWLILPSCWAHQFQLILGDYFKVNDMAAVIAEDATAIISWINNHGKVRKIFDEAQKTISLDRLGKIIILAYLVANITRWTTHFIAFCRLFLLRAALQLAVLQNRSAIIAAEVGTATSMEGVCLREDAKQFCTLIEDSSFWSGLETVLGDLEPICLGTNINQKDYALGAGNYILIDDNGGRMAWL